jgi:dihydrofolate reductase
MRPLGYSINVTLDGCCDHLAGIPDEDTHRHATDIIAQADALIFGRVIYEMMEEAWRPVAKQWPEGRPEWMRPFAKTIDAAKKYVVSDTLKSVDWNAEIIRGADLEKTVRALKQQPGRGIYTGGVTLPLALAQLGLIDEYEFMIHPRIAGHGPTPFAGLLKYVDLKLIGKQEFAGGAVAMKYAVKR